MLNPVASAPTCAAGWLAAVERLIDLGGEAYNLVVDIDNPVSHPKEAADVILGLDRFLRDRNANPVVTVANTIFPQDLYRRHGAQNLRTEYLQAYDRIHKKGWGRYFERMVRWPTNGKGTCDQLHDLIANLSKQLRASQTFHNVYELTLFDPARDARRNRNRQCLSFLSFKHHPVRGLMLTAMYRNHHYIARALGNFIGLGNLMAYIAQQVGTRVGPLTCVSTHAVLDSAAEQWTKQDAMALIKKLGLLCPASTAGTDLGARPLVSA